MTEKTSREDEIRRWLEGHGRAWDACDQLEQADGHLRYLLEKVERLEGKRVERCTNDYQEAIVACRTLLGHETPFRYEGRELNTGERRFRFTASAENAAEFHEHMNYATGEEPSDAT